MKLEDQPVDRTIDTKIAYRRVHLPNQPMMAYIGAFARRSGKIYWHCYVYDTVWPQTIFAQWGKWAPQIWREVVKQIKSNIAFELFAEGREVKDPSQSINLSRNSMDDNKQDAFTRAAIQIIMERIEQQKSA